MKKAAVTIMMAASTLLAVGQIEGTLLNELDDLAQMQEEGAGGMNPETAYYEATGSLGVESQMEEASQQVQQSMTQEAVESYDAHQQVPQDTVPLDTQQQILLDNPAAG